jgi:aspartate/methionine/tyrosine aminotransferase
MNRTHRAMGSPYMEWAKLQSGARFTLATSGILSVSASEFPLPVDPLEINAPGGYGHKPLLDRIGHHTGAPVDCVVEAAGTSMANHLAMAAVMEPGDTVLIEQPAYGPLLDVADYLGARVQRVRRRFEHGFAIDLDELARALADRPRLIVLTNLHNPSSALIPAGTMRKIAEMAQRAGAYVLVDEAYLDILFDGGTHSAFAIGEELGGENPIIVTNSLTKVYGLSGLRCGWILAAPPLARKMWRLNDLFAANAPHAAEQLSVLAFDHLERFRERARALIAANRPLLDGFLDSRAELECFRPGFGTVVFPRLKNGDPEELFALLRERYETTVVPGRFFEMPQHFRVGISGRTEELREGLQRLGAALDEIAR